MPWVFKTQTKSLILIIKYINMDYDKKRSEWDSNEKVTESCGLEMKSKSLEVRWDVNIQLDSQEKIIEQLHKTTHRLAESLDPILSSERPMNWDCEWKDEDSSMIGRRIQWNNSSIQSTIYKLEELISRLQV